MVRYRKQRKSMTWHSLCLQLILNYKIIFMAINYLNAFPDYICFIISISNYLKPFPNFRWRGSVPVWAGGLGQMTSKGSFQPQPCCGSVIHFLLAAALVLAWLLGKSRTNSPTWEKITLFLWLGGTKIFLQGEWIAPGESQGTHK